MKIDLKTDQPWSIKSEEVFPKASQTGIQNNHQLYSDLHISRRNDL